MIGLVCPAGACGLKQEIFGVETDYKIAGKTGDPETLAYLQTVLRDVADQKAKSLSNDPAQAAKEEDYLEQAIKGQLLKALQAKGYYDARIDFKNDAKPLSGEYDVSSGPKYVISRLTVSPRTYEKFYRSRKVTAGAALDAQTVLDAQGRFYDAIQKDRCYFSLKVDNQVALDHEARSGALGFKVDAGREGTYGQLAIEGNGGVRDSYLRKLVPWKEGDCFRREQLERYKTSLLESGLFSRAEIELPDQPAADGSVPMTLAVTERAARTLSAGVTYYSDEGPGATLGWEHRNLFGAAEKLTTTLQLSQIEQSLNADFLKPYFLRKDQSLSLTSALKREDTDAYRETGLTIGGAVNRTLTPHLSASGGVKLTLSQIDDRLANTSSTYGLVSLPGSLTYDTRDSKLDPHKGVNLSVEAAPYFDALGSANPFFKIQASGSHYLSFDKKSRIVLASRVGLGSIQGASIENVPATERFYAGGGGSVRGFDYQAIGPQKDGDPTGGLSIASGTLELRTKFTGTIGGVLFIDAASITENSTPDFSKPAVGAGIGLRYYTGFGPLRFDIATPLTQTNTTGKNYQFYISIGQAF